MYQNVVEQRDGKKKKKKKQPKTKTNLEAIRGKGSHPEIRDCTGKKRERDCTEMGRVSMSSPRRQKVKGKSHLLGMGRNVWKMLKYKRQAGMRVLFQSTCISAHFGHSSPLRNQKGDQMGRLVSQTPVKNCQQEVLSLPRPALPGKTPGGVRGGFSLWRPMCEPKEIYGLEDWCSASSRDRLLGSGS